ncbi:MAG: phosphate acetyltransferase [Oscillospiraceae bacterium]|nr:phosphate acetyltransferase [Oscillospiraceae bacterium]
MSFMDGVISKAKSEVKTIVLPESENIRTILATAKVLEHEIAKVVLLGNEASIEKLTEGYDISGAKIVDIYKSDLMDDYVETFYELRKSKGITKDEAAVAMKNPLYYGVMMVKKGEVDGMVAGAINSTSNTLRPALQILKTSPGTKLVSSFFMMDVPDRSFGLDGLFMFADCALVENPTAEEMAEIAVASARSFETFVGKQPIVAMLSYSTYGSAKSEMTQKVVEATRLAKEKAPDLMIDGELQLDAAIIESIGRSKAPNSAVAGKANVLVFPDLNSGNIGYKLTQRLAKAEAHGPVIQGLAKPVNDLSRGCSAEDIVNVVALTCVQAQRAPRRQQE